MNATIDLNCDMGESYGRWRLGSDKDLMPYITSANVAAGYHAGDPGTIRRTVFAAAEHGLQVGAHVALPDLMGFGRRRMDIAPKDLRDYVVYQVGAVQAFATAAGITLGHVKPHGALYVMASSDPDIADAMAAAVADVDATMSLLLQDLRQEDVVAAHGIRLIAEGFPDLHYDADGNLMVEGVKEPWDPELVAQRAVQMAVEGTVDKINGEKAALDVRTLCIHGDGPNALDIVKAVRSALDAAHVLVQPMGLETDANH